MAQHREQFGGFDNRFFHLACERDETLFDAVEVLLKGRRTSLPSGVVFKDKDGSPRHNVRTKWFPGRRTRGHAGGAASPETIDDACVSLAWRGRASG